MYGQSEKRESRSESLSGVRVRSSMPWGFFHASIIERSSSYEIIQQGRGPEEGKLTKTAADPNMVNKSIKKKECLEYVFSEYSKRVLSVNRGYVPF